MCALKIIPVAPAVRIRRKLLYEEILFTFRDVVGYT